MPGIHQTRQLPYSAEQMFDLVADVGSYPEFLPWVIATRVRAGNSAQMTADMVVGFKSVREKFTSLVEMVRPERLQVNYIDGPMRDLDNRWLFKPLSDGGCEIDFRVDFTFRNRIFAALAGQYFDRAFRKMMVAFEQRAETLYGSSISSAQRVA